MADLNVEHLVVGGGLLGLATADHLLRRGAHGVVVFEAEASLGMRARMGPALVLSTGRESERALEKRARLLLSEWPDYIEHDPGFVRCGATAWQPAPARSDWHQRVSEGAIAADVDRYHVPDDGIVDVMRVCAGLNDQVRKRGGRVLTGLCVESLRDDGEAIAFDATGRSGRAGIVYLTAGPNSVHLARTLGLALGYPQQIEQRFELVASARELAIERLPVSPAPTRAPNDFRASAIGALLEFDDDDLGDAHTASTVIGNRDDADSAELDVLLTCDPSISAGRSGPSGWVCHSYRTVGAAERDATVDWTVWERFRHSHRDAIPGLEGARVRSAHARLILGLEQGGVRPRRELDGRVMITGAFGAFGTGLALVAAEQLAELALGLPMTVPVADG